MLAFFSVTRTRKRLGFFSKSLFYRAENDDGTIWLEREAEFLRVSRGDRKKYYFESVADSQGICRLRAIKDKNDNILILEYSLGGFLGRVIDTLKRETRFSYDAQNRLSCISLRSDRNADEYITKRKYSYDMHNNLVHVEDALGRITRYEYMEHLLVREIGPDGNSYYWIYDDSRRCVETWREGGTLYRRLRFDDRNKKVEVTDSLGYRTIYEHDGSNNILVTTDPLGHRLENTYDSRGSLLATTGGNTANRAVSFFDEKNNCLTVVNTNGMSTRHYFNEKNLPVRVEDGNGLVWLKEYDEKGQLIHSLAPGGFEWHFEYADQGYVCKATNALGHEIYQERGPTRRVVCVRDSLGVISRKEYDVEGNMVALINEANRRTCFEYDLAGRLIRITLHDGIVNVCQYDANDNVIALIDGLGQVYRYEYDASGMLIREINCEGDSLFLQYDTEQRLTAITNWKGEKTTLTYDALARPIAIVLFDGVAERYEYDEIGNLVSVIKGDGTRIRSEYSSDGWLQARILPDGSITSYEFEDGLLRSAVNMTMAVRREFDSRLRLVSEAQGDWRAKFTYDTIDNLVRIEESGGRYTNHEFDERRRVVKIEDSTFGIYHFEYDAVDLLTKWFMPNGTVVRNEYDEQDRLAAIQVVSRMGEEMFQLELKYDSLDRLIRQTASFKGEQHITEYEYNRRDQITQVIHEGQVREWYGYDSGGNIVEASSYGAAEIGPGNRLMQAGETSFRYDANGNMIEKRNRQGITRFSYNASDELVMISHPNTELSKFGYDPVGRRVWKRHNGKNVHYYWSNDTVYKGKGGR